MTTSTLAHVIQQIISSQEENDKLMGEMARLRAEVERLNSLLHPKPESQAVKSEEQTEKQQ